MSGIRVRKKLAKRSHVYVIALDKAVLEVRKFREENPGYIEGKPCVYVGMTSKDPKTRFAEHKRGYKSGKYVKRYGRYLRRRLYEKYNPMSYEEAQRREVQLARDLRAKGYGVHQN